MHKLVTQAHCAFSRFYSAKYPQNMVWRWVSKPESFDTLSSLKFEQTIIDTLVSNSSFKGTRIPTKEAATISNLSQSDLQNLVFLLDSEEKTNLCHTLFEIIRVMKANDELKQIDFSRLITMRIRYFIEKKDYPMAIFILEEFHHFEAIDRLHEVILMFINAYYEDRNELKAVEWLNRLKPSTEMSAEFLIEFDLVADKLMKFFYDNANPYDGNSSRKALLTHPLYVRSSKESL